MWKFSGTKSLAALAGFSLFLQGCETSTPKAVAPDGSITELKLADDAVVSAKIKDANVITSKIKDGAVTAAKLDSAMAMAVASGTFSGNLSVGGTSTLTGTTTMSGAATVGAGLSVTSTTGTGVSVSRTDTTAYATTVGKSGISSSFSASPSGASTEIYFASLNDMGLGTTNSVAQAVGTRGKVTLNAAGTVTVGVGVDSKLDFQAAGTTTSYYSFHSNVANTGAGTMTKYIGMWLEDPDNLVTTAKAGTRYGLFIDQATTSINFMNGRLGIQNVTPAFPLDVTGAGNFTGALTVGGAGTFTGALATSSTLTVTGASALNGTVAFSGIGASNATGALCFGAGNTVTTATSSCTVVSDRRFKENIQPVQGALDKILKLTGVTYFWKDKAKRGSQRELGVIAQDVEPIFPEAVSKGKDGFYGVYYISLISPLIEAVKELHAKWLGDHEQLNQQKVLLGQIEKKIEIENIALKAENKALKERLDKIEMALAQASPSKTIQKKGRKLAELKQ